MAKTRVYRIESIAGVSLCEAPTKEAAALSEALRLGLIRECRNASTAEVTETYRKGDVFHRVGDKPAEGQWVMTPPPNTRYSRSEEGPFEARFPSGPGPWWLCVSEDEGKTWSKPVLLVTEGRPATAEGIHVDFRRAEADGTTLSEVAEAAERLGVTSTTVDGDDRGSVAS